MSLVNYLGTYETLDQVWEAYPEGGKEGDYLHIASDLKKWNKYTSAWADPTEEDVEGSTIVSLEEDVVVGSSTLINYLGRFETLGDALNAYPEGGNEGDYIYVGDDIYAWDKYANEWVVSSDAPLEVAISEEDIIPNSNTFINYLGGFVDRDAVWHKYPEGGKVGDYLYIASDLHIWNKYICNWVAATPPDESSQIRPIEHLSQEGVVEYSENYINYLGVFESIEQAWEAYPEGGKEGDYIIVGGEQLRWNKYTSNWGEYDPDASTPARPVATIYGDLHVHNDVIIGEDLYARILETFTTKKWVLEQGYISLDDVTSELVMSKIVPDNTTIEVRDGKLVVIGGGSGGGTADSVAWDDVTDKPKWIKDTPPTLEEISGSNGDGFVTILSDQTIEGVKNFAKGAKFNSALLSYDDEKKAWVFPGNIIATGGIAAFSSIEGFTPATITDAVNIDWDTIIKKDGVLMLNPELEFGGIDEEQLEEYLKPYAKTADIANTYATKASLDTLNTRLDDFLTASDTDTIINKWSELETFLAGLAESDNLATILSGKANKATTLAGYGITDAYTKSHIDSNFVSIGTKQQITGEKDFVGGFKVNGGLVEYNATLKTWVFNGDLLVTGGMAAFSNISGFKPSTITDAVLIDDRTIKRNADGLLYAVAQGAGGINEDQLEDYLTFNGYATQSWVENQKYITSSALNGYATESWVLSQRYLTGISSSMVTDALGYNPYNSANFTKANIKSTLGISDWAMASVKPNYTATEVGAVTESTALHSGSLNDFITAGIYRFHTPTDTTGGMTNHGNLFVIRGGSLDTFAQLYFNYNGDGRIFSRSGDIYNYLNRSWHTLAFTSDIPTKLSQLTDDVVAGKYLSLSGGTVNGSITATSFIGDLAGTADNALYIIPQIYTGDVNVSDIYKNKSFVYRVSANTNLPGTLYYGNILYIGGEDTGFMLASGYYNDRLLFRSGINRLALGGEPTIHTNEWKDIAFTDSNVASATKLQTPRTIWGQSFDGTGNITDAINLSTSDQINGTLGGIALNFNAGKEVPTSIYNGRYAIIATFLPDGSAAIGGTTASEKLHVYGNILATGGITAQNSSDRRLKRNIRKFNASKVLMSLGGVYEYEYIDSEVQKNHIYEGTHYGLIYQNITGTNLNVMCHEREDGFGTLNYQHQKFISLIAGATMENITEVEKLKRKIRSLEAKVKQLERGEA